MAKYPPDTAKIVSGWRIVVPENLREGLEIGDWVKFIGKLEKLEDTAQKEVEEEDG